MGYTFSKNNRLKYPINYTYATFEGKKFLDFYFNDRKSRIMNLTGRSLVLFKASMRDEIGKAINERLREEAILASSFSINERIVLKDLLSSVLSQTVSSKIEQASPWVARIIQRYEVSKKLFAEYAPGFRKGEGALKDLSAYLEFALCLAYLYALKNKLQYLSTLMKLVDMLLSMERGYFSAAKDIDDLEIIVGAELFFFKDLLSNCGLSIEI